MKKRLFTLLTLLVLLFTVGCSTETPASTPTTEPAATPAEATPATEEAQEPVQGMTGDIHVYTRDATSGTREAFEKGIGLDEKETPLTASAVETSGNGDMATRVGKDTLAIGYVSLTTDFAANNLKALKYEGVEPTVENVLNDTYTLKRPFSYVTRAKGDFASPEAEALTAAFVKFLTESEEGLSAVESAGGIVDMTNAKPWKEVAATVEGFDLTKDYSGVTLRTRGSTSVEKTLKAALEAFQAEVTFEFNMDQTGSGDGYKRILGAEKDGANAGDIGFASRAFGSEEAVTNGMNSGVYCQDAVVVVVENANTLQDITAETVKNIFTGKTTSWDDVK